jgi:hypothetical protein
LRHGVFYQLDLLGDLRFICRANVAGFVATLARAAPVKWCWAWRTAVV